MINSQLIMSIIIYEAKVKTAAPKLRLIRILLQRKSIDTASFVSLKNNEHTNSLASAKNFCRR